MNEFYKKIAKIGPDSALSLVTVLNGVNSGEKAAFDENGLAFCSSGEDYFRAHEKELMSMSEDGVHNLLSQIVYTEHVRQGKKLVICGCGHVSLPIIRLAKMLGFEVTAIDDRSEFCENAREAGADRVITAGFEEALNGIEGSRGHYFVVVTRGHSWDEKCLRLICEKTHAYIGAMGSARRVAIVRENLLKTGVDKNVLDRVYSPIGLEIGAETPEEIAVSIMAQITAVKNSDSHQAFPKDILDAINTPVSEGEASEKKILATIIQRKGSAPRSVGTKMLILKDRIINTIGGGLLESKVIRHGRDMLEEEINTLELRHFELSADAASTEGEVCGGEIEVLFETLY